MGYKLSNQAEQDLRLIYRYSRQNFGGAQASAYLTGLEESIEQLAETSSMAQKVDHIRSGYKRYIYREHIIYFIERQTFIYIVRVLHQKMKASLHLG